MKRISWILFLVIGFAVAFTACEDDEPDTPATPTISSFTPTSGEVGTAVTISGTNFGTSPTVTFGTTSATVSSSTATSISVTVPQLAAGNYTINVTANGQSAASSAQFTVTEEGEELETIATIAAGNDDLSTLVAALQAADLVETLDGETAYTVFAPTNDAFAAALAALAPNATAEDLLAAGPILEATLLDHVVEGTVASSGLSDGQEIEALSGNTLIVSIDGDEVRINGALVSTPDVAASNGVVHIVDGVIVAAPAGELTLHLALNGNVVADPELAGIGREADQTLDPVPAAEAVTSDLAAYPDDEFFTEVGYKGAFDPAGTNWMEGWSTLWKLGYLIGAPSTPEAPYDPATATIETLPNSITADTELTSDKVWKLDGLTYVESGTLTIQPGTVVIAETEPTTGDNTSALVITSGGLIDAQGTADAPVIFTTEEDDGTLAPSETGQWGGVILLGTAPIGFGTGTNSIEGIDPNEPRGQYGGSDADDDSGIMTYVSIRYSGVGIEPGSEIQGLSLGGVGSGTTLEYIDIFSSGDDGIEIFGGTIDIKYAIAAFADDDSWDFDEGWTGNGQFWFSIQNDLNTADNGFEWDGANPNNTEPYSNPTLYNFTVLGRGQDATGRDVTAQAVLMRDNTAGTLANSIIADFNGKGIEVEDEADTEGDSYNHLLNGEIHLLNNIWQVNADYTDLTSGDTGIVRPTE